MRNTWKFLRVAIAAFAAAAAVCVGCGPAASPQAEPPSARGGLGEQERSSAPAEEPGGRTAEGAGGYDPMQAPSKIDPFKSATEITFNQNKAANMDFSGKLRCDYHGEKVTITLKKDNGPDIQVSSVKYKVKSPPYEHIVTLDNEGDATTFRIMITSNGNDVLPVAGECDYDSSVGDVSKDCSGGSYSFPSALFGEPVEFTFNSVSGKLLYATTSGNWIAADASYRVHLQPPSNPNCAAVR